MKFIMIMIICFGADCKALFDTAETFDSYESCYAVARETSLYMHQLYPQSAGEIHCFNKVQFKEFQKFLDDGNKPTLTNRVGLEA